MCKSFKATQAIEDMINRGTPLLGKFYLDELMGDNWYSRDLFMSSIKIETLC
jgi:hypothetical protein